MERNTIEALREKVRDHELRPILWAKEETWNRLQLRQQPKYRLYYAVAASLLMVALTTGYLVMQNQDEATKKQTASSDVQDSVTSIVGKKNPPAFVPVQPPVLKQRDEKAKQQLNKPRITLNESLLPTDSLPVQVNEIPPIVIAADSIPKAEVAEAVAASEKKIEVIIGVVTSDPVLSLNDKKVKFKFLDEMNKKPFRKTNDDAKFVIARIK